MVRPERRLDRPPPVEQGVAGRVPVAVGQERPPGGERVPAVAGVAERPGDRVPAEQLEEVPGVAVPAVVPPRHVAPGHLVLCHPELPAAAGNGERR